MMFCMCLPALAALFLITCVAKPLNPSLLPLPRPVGLVVQDSDLVPPISISVAVIVCLSIVVTAVLVVVILATRRTSVHDVPDSDFVDVTTHEQLENANEEEITSVGGKVKKNGKYVRGRDIVWVEVKVFPTAPEFYASDLAKKISDDYTASRKRQFNYAEITEYRCTYARKLGFQPCPRKMRVLFMSHCQEVRVETSHDCPQHLHEEDSQSLLNHPSSNYRWSTRMNEIIEQCVANHGKPKVAIRNMEEAGCFQNINRPSMEQLYNKMAAMKKLLNKNPNLTNTFEMRQLVSQHLDIPEDPDDAYIPFYEIKDDDSHDLRFNIMFTTSRCLARSAAF